MKNIYDQIPGLPPSIQVRLFLIWRKVVQADLSHRKVEYRLPGLSFRNIWIYRGGSFPSYSLEEILAGKVEFPYKEARPLKLFMIIYRQVYYPFSRYGISRVCVHGVINQMESDIPILRIWRWSAVKLKKIIICISSKYPFQTKLYKKLARDLDISRNVLPDYMELFGEGLVNLLRKKRRAWKYHYWRK